MHRRLSGVGGKPPIHRSCAKPRSIGRTPTPVRMNAGFSQSECNKGTLIPKRSGRHHAEGRVRLGGLFLEDSQLSVLVESRSRGFSGLQVGGHGAGVVLLVALE